MPSVVRGHQRAAVYYKRAWPRLLGAHSIAPAAVGRRSLLPQSQWKAASCEFSAPLSFAPLELSSAGWDTDIAVSGPARHPETSR